MDKAVHLNIPSEREQKRDAVLFSAVGVTRFCGHFLYSTTKENLSGRFVLCITGGFSSQRGSVLHGRCDWKFALLCIFFPKSRNAVLFSPVVVTVCVHGVVSLSRVVSQRGSTE